MCGKKAVPSGLAERFLLVAVIVVAA